MDEFGPTQETRFVLEAEPLWAFVVVLLAGVLLFVARRRAWRLGASVAPASPDGLRRLAKVGYLAVVVLVVAFGTVGALLALLGPVRTG